jgi:hypothetical protein
MALFWGGFVSGVVFMLILAWLATPPIDPYDD